MTFLPLRMAAADLHAADTPDALLTALHAARAAAIPHISDGVANAAGDVDSHARNLLRADAESEEAVTTQVAELADLLDEAALAAGEYTAEEEVEREMHGLVMLDQFVQESGGSSNPDGNPWTPIRPE